MAAEYRARQKSLNGWRNKEGGFNYTLINRSGTLSTPTTVSAINPRVLPWKREYILKKIQFVIYFLAIFNKRARGKIHSGKIKRSNPRPLPRANSPPLATCLNSPKISIFRANLLIAWVVLFFIGLLEIFAATPDSKILPASFSKHLNLITFCSISEADHFSLPNTFQEIAGNRFNSVILSCEQLFPPAVVREVNSNDPNRENPPYLAFAPQDSAMLRLLPQNPLLPKNPLTGETLTDVLRLESDNSYLLEKYLEGDPFAIDKYENDLSRLPPEKRELMERAVVASKQRLLKDLGYYSASIDSIDGPVTRAAWKQFERDSHSKNWKTRYNLAMKFFEAGKKTGIISYYDKTVDHLFWIAQEYSILLPTDTRNKMYDLLWNIAEFHDVNKTEEYRKMMEPELGPIVWYSKGKSEYQMRKEVVKPLKACIYLFPNRGPPRWSLKSIGAEDEIPLREPTMEEIDIFMSGDESKIKGLYYKFFPERKPSKDKSSGNGPRSLNYVPSPNKTYAHRIQMPLSLPEAGFRHSALTYSSHISRHLCQGIYCRPIDWR